MISNCLAVLVLTMMTLEKASCSNSAERKVYYLNKISEEKDLSRPKLVRNGRDYNKEALTDHRVKLKLINKKENEFASAINIKSLQPKSLRIGRDLENLNTKELLEPKMENAVDVIENTPILAYLPVIILPYPIYINQSDVNTTETDSPLLFDTRKPLFVVSTSGLHQGNGGGFRPHSTSSSQHYSSSFYNRPWNSNFRSNTPQSSTGRPFVIQQTFKPYFQWRPVTILKPPQA